MDEWDTWTCANIHGTKYLCHNHSPYSWLPPGSDPNPLYLLELFLFRETPTNFAASSRGSFLHPQLKFKLRERSLGILFRADDENKVSQGNCALKTGEDNKCFMKFYILRSNSMHKKGLGANPHCWENILFWSVKI